MDKKEAIKLFGSSSKLADAVGVSPAAVSRWREPLSERVKARVIMAALREGKPIPPHWLKREKSA